MNDTASQVIVFSLQPHSLSGRLVAALDAEEGLFDTRQFPDGESYLRVVTLVQDRDCLVLADLSHPDSKYLALMFLLETLRELGAGSVGLVAPYLSYMRQDIRFLEGEAVTSRLFAAELSRHIDWLVTVDPHLHRYHSLDEIYPIPSRVVSSEPALTRWLNGQTDLLLVGPDSESEQWISGIADACRLPYVIGEKQRRGDREVEVNLPNLDAFHNLTAVIVDDVISSGETILQCVHALRRNDIGRILCLAVHGIFADGVDQRLLQSGLDQLVTTNTIEHSSNAVDVSDWIAPAVLDCLHQINRRLS